jgi:hypothetical protein
VSAGAPINLLLKCRPALALSLVAVAGVVNGGIARSETAAARHRSRRVDPAVSTSGLVMLTTA